MGIDFLGGRWDLFFARQREKNLGCEGNPDLPPPQIPFFVVGKTHNFSAISYGAWYPLGNLRFPLRDDNFFPPDFSHF